QTNVSRTFRIAGIRALLPHPLAIQFLNADEIWSATHVKREKHMRVRIGSFLGLCFAVLLSFVLAFSAVAQDKTPKKAAKEQNIQGTVKALKKESPPLSR